LWGEVKCFTNWWNIGLLVQNTIRSVDGGFKVPLQVSDCGRNKMFNQLTKNRQHKFLVKQIKWIAQSDFYWPKTYYGCLAWDCGFNLPWAHKWVGYYFTYDCLASGLWVHFVTSPDIALVPVIKGNHYQVNYWGPGWPSTWYTGV
jgi:hypothetical protein